MSDGRKEFDRLRLLDSQLKLPNTASRTSTLRQKLSAIKHMIAKSFDRVSKTQALIDELKEAINNSQKRK